MPVVVVVDWTRGEDDGTKKMDFSLQNQGAFVLLFEAFWEKK